MLKVLVDYSRAFALDSSMFLAHFGWSAILAVTARYKGMHLFYMLKIGSVHSLATSYKLLDSSYPAHYRQRLRHKLYAWAANECQCLTMRSSGPLVVSNFAIDPKPTRSRMWNLLSSKLWFNFFCSNSLTNISGYLLLEIMPSKSCNNNSRFTPCCILLMPAQRVQPTCN